ncbi:MAG: sulfatase-like hydrolase/transferase [Chloroflexota bacterium]|nr:sulfatase-like hydrolase/transferase [Chloroflexota bacterium]
MQARPNILFICTDQQRYDALGCYGNEHIITPSIDQLAMEGVLFERCYVQSPVCASARASLFTGRYPSAHGVWANGVALPPHEQLFTQALAGSGYDCGLVGKLHLAAAFGGRTETRLDHGFRFWRWAHDPYHDAPGNQYHRWLEARYPELYAAVQAPEGNVRFETLPVEAHYSHWVAEETIAFLQSARDPTKPFFLMANFFDPHHPFGAPPAYLQQYDPARLPRPIEARNELESKPPILTEASHESYAGHAPGFTTYSSGEIQELVATYYAMVTLIDDEVKRILTTLDELGLRDETLVVFTSDHGEMLGDHNLLLKGPMMYEGAVRVPLILRWPGHLAEATRYADLVQWIDLCPTIMEVANLPPLPRNQAESLLPLIRGEERAFQRDWALCMYRNSGHPYDPPVHSTMLRYDQYKLVVYHGPPATRRARAGELYDLEADPLEVVNLWDDPHHSALRSELEALLLDVFVAIEDRTQPREAYW